MAETARRETAAVALLRPVTDPQAAIAVLRRAVERAQAGNLVVDIDTGHVRGKLVLTV